MALFSAETLLPETHPPYPRDRPKARFAEQNSIRLHLPATDRRWIEVRLPSRISVKTPHDPKRILSGIAARTITIRFTSTYPKSTRCYPRCRWRAAFRTERTRYA